MHLRHEATKQRWGEDRPSSWNGPPMTWHNVPREVQNLPYGTVHEPGHHIPRYVDRGGSGGEWVGWIWITEKRTLKRQPFWEETTKK